jgi:hypothetical protein
MLELKSKNLFIKYGNSSQYCISKVFDFYDIIGKNCLFLYTKGCSLASLMKFNKQVFTTSSLEHILPNHLFRLDYIIVSSNHNIEENYQTIRKITDIPVVFIVDFGSAKANIEIKNFDTVYILSQERGITTSRLTIISNGEKLEECLVEDLKGGSKSNLRELKIQYIRDKNLRDLLGDEE